MSASAGLAALRGRRVVLGVAGGIAAYKAVEICRRLVDAGAHVSPVLTEDATRFIGALTFSALASEPARTSLFDGPDPIPHTRLGQTADLVIVAPATAKLLGKYAAGISDDLLTATLLATRAPVLVAPAMHTEMWEHAAVQENLVTLRRRGVHVVDPESGRLAGGDVGAGRLADPARIVVAAAEILSRGRDLAGLRVLVTAGGTREAIDPVRFVGNRSSGKMGFAVAEVAASRGAAVTLVCTRTPPASGGTETGAIETVRVETAEDMHREVLARFPDARRGRDGRRGRRLPAQGDRAREAQEARRPARDRARADPGHPRCPRCEQDRAAARRASRPRPSGCEEHAAEKLAAKRLDLIVANDVSAPDAGFEVDTNRAVLLDSSGSVERDALAEQGGTRRCDPRPGRHSTRPGLGDRRRASHEDGPPFALRRSWKLVQLGGAIVSSYPFTSESVTEGHPDKMCDQISDAVLDAIFAEDPNSRVACETLVTTGLVVVAGEISTQAYVDIPRVVRDTVNAIGYDRESFGFDGHTCGVITSDRRAVARHRDGRRQGGRAAGGNR